MKRITPLCLAALLALSLSCSALAAGELGQAALYPVEVTEYLDGDSPRLAKTYLLTPVDDPAAIPTGDFEREGQTYTLLDMTRQDNVETETRDYVETITLESKSKDMDQIMPLLSATREVTTEDGYTGVLTLDTAGICVEASGYASATRTVTAARTYPNLSDADVSLIPKSVTENGRTLELSDVQWQEAGGFFNASATYSGTASSRYATGYTVTADYTGEVTRTKSDTVTYTAIFSGQPIQVEPMSGTDTTGWRWLLTLPLGLCGAGLAVLAIRLKKQHRTKKDWEEYTK